MSFVRITFFITHWLFNRFDYHGVMNIQNSIMREYFGGNFEIPGLFPDAINTPYYAPVYTIT